MQNIRSPLSGWIGGKYQLSDQIIDLFPSHYTYVEVFAGAAWVLFRKAPSKVEVINDINNELVTFYRILQNHFEEFCRSLEWAIVSRSTFEHYKQLSPSMLTDIQRAVRFYYLQRNCFGGKMLTLSFGISTTTPPKAKFMDLQNTLKAAHERLSRVYVECLPYDEIISRYDRSETFFYLDPPYWNNENLYGKGIFSKLDFSNLASMLARIKGKFLLSINDIPELRTIFEDFTIEETKEINYTCTKGKNNKVRELLVKNY